MVVSAQVKLCMILHLKQEGPSICAALDVYLHPHRPRLSRSMFDDVT